ncbi:GYDIA family GHMP kinase [Flavobacterium restrictum]|uniref:GHMP kinase n=1 Tax=Flavobacterium restrictum TaxID=2594428 RepID=A0A553DWT3_9FLAO|nr:GYDIA family GHMP kinase [Flavobacterium restrictum]TRX37093.1 GHMP kinase [Flavobacterium restrictum]
MKRTFYSNGKLLLTGEYLVLDGAKALALPTKFGQNLSVSSGKNQEIQWQSFDADGNIWFQETVLFSEIITPPEWQNESVKTTLLTILHQGYLVNPSFITQSEGYEITTELTFPRKWGLGTSSTLINNVAQWLQIDAFALLQNSFGGSGYDIACAQNDTPILYQLEQGKPVVEPVVFAPDFSEHLFFVYLNQKQSSKAAIAAYYNNKNAHLAQNSAVINKITQVVLDASTLSDFAKAIEKHEIVMSNILEMKTVKEALFPDFKGIIKSLGAWGGDFVLVISKENPKDYFANQGYTTIIPYAEMILI